MATKTFSVENIGLGSVKKISAQLESQAYDAEIDVGLIDLAEKNDYNSQDSEKEIKLLAETIDYCGLLHNLVLVAKDDGRFEMVSGEKRYLAITRHLHWPTIRSRIYPANTPKGKIRVSLDIANLTQRDYSPAQMLELYESFRENIEQMKAAGEYSGGIQEGIAEMLGVSTRQVRTYQTIVEHATAEEREAIKEKTASMTEVYERVNDRKHGVEPKKESFEEIKVDEKYIKAALKLKMHTVETLLFYMLKLPTGKEAVTWLKSVYKWSGGTVVLEDYYGHINFHDKVELDYAHREKIYYSYAEIDVILRDMIRKYEFASENEVLEILKHKLK